MATETLENLRADLVSARDRETATRNILDAISRSRGDETPVFEMILENAAHLCRASTAALLHGQPDGPHLTLVALFMTDAERMAGVDEIVARVNRVPMALDPDVHIAAQAICSGEVVNIADLSQTKSYLSGEPTFRIMVDTQGQRWFGLFEQMSGVF